MKTTYQVQWRPLFLSLSVSLSLAILLPLGALLLFRVVRFGAAEAFRHVTPSGVTLIATGIVVVTTMLAFLASQVIRRSYVTLDANFIEGQGYWGKRKTLPLGELTSLSRKVRNGIEMVAVESRSHGKIYISAQTEKLPELLQRIKARSPGIIGD